MNRRFFLISAILIRGLFGAAVGLLIGLLIMHLIPIERSAETAEVRSVRTAWHGEVEGREMLKIKTSEEVLLDIVSAQVANENVLEARATIDAIKDGSVKDSFRLFVIRSIVQNKRTEHLPIRRFSPIPETVRNSQESESLEVTKEKLEFQRNQLLRGAKEREEQLAKDKAWLKELVEIKDSIDNNLYKAEAMRSIAEFQRTFDSPLSNESLKESVKLAISPWVSDEEPRNRIWRIVGLTLLSIIGFMAMTISKATLESWGNSIASRITRKGKAEPTDKNQSHETPKVEGNGKSLTVAGPPV